MCSQLTSSAAEVMTVRSEHRQQDLIGTVSNISYISHIILLQILFFLKNNKAFHIKVLHWLILYSLMFYLNLLQKASSNH